MHTVVFGCNQLGAALACNLSRQKHNVVVVDEVQASFKRLPVDFGGFALNGVYAEARTWEQARLGQAHIAYVVLEDFTTSLMLASVAQQHYHVPRIVCLAQDRYQAGVLQRLQIDTVQTDQLIADALASHLSM